jgi:Zn-dependent M28 family amino/carboxypeptidase
MCDFLRPVVIGCSLPFLFLTGCASKPPDEALVPRFDENGLRGHLQILASDEYEGRRPATPGEDKTVAYIEEQFKAAGLQPGAGNSFRQPVPFVELSTRPADTVDLQGPAGKLALRYGDEVAFWTRHPVTEMRLEPSELVFVGYGITEPTMDWADYAGVDMRGKTAVILVNDPGYVTGDPALFRGKAMTYHGRWTYKFEEAARQGAVAAIIVHETGPAGYPWEVVRNGAAKPQLIIDTPGAETGRLKIEGWMTVDAARRVFQAAGLDFDAEKARATQRGYRAHPLGLTASTWVRNAVRRAVSSNVVGVLPGTERPDEYVIYTAHWDHLGKALAFGDDAIFNGAVDNATGMASLLDLARAFGEVKPRPERSIAFIAFTGEEFGLLGSEYFAEHPTMPVAKIAGGMNMDALYPIGATRDMTVIGLGASELEKYLEEAAARQGRVLHAEALPEAGHYYRSDHFNLAKKGVPMLYTKTGFDSVKRGPEWGKQWEVDYYAKTYHKPVDEFDPSWELDGMVQDQQVLFDVGYRLSRERRFPEWYPGNEFRPVREQSLKQASAGTR